MPFLPKDFTVQPRERNTLLKGRTPAGRGNGFGQARSQQASKKHRQCKNYQLFNYLKFGIFLVSFICVLVAKTLQSELQSTILTLSHHHLQSTQFSHMNFPMASIFKTPTLRLPWWSSGQELTGQCRGHGFRPWSGKIPHTAGKLHPGTTATEGCRSRADAPQEKPLQ